MELWPLVLVPSIICIPLSIYSNLKLFKYRNEMLVQKRCSFVVFGLNASIICMMITLLHYGIASISAIPTDHLFTPNYAIILCLVSWCILLFFLNVGSFYIYYQHKYLYYMVQLDWQRIINTHIVQLHETMHTTNWYIQNHSKYGNLSYISKLFGCYHLICCILANAALFTPQIGGIISLSMFTPLILFYAVILHKTPSFEHYEDIFFIHWEHKHHARLISILILLQFIVAIAVQVNVDHGTTLLCIFIALCTLVLGRMHYVSTYGIIHKVRESSRLGSSSTTALTTPQNRAHITLKTICSHHKSLNLFVVHLSKEFSMECLLSFIEFTQFQRYLLSMNTNENSKLHTIKDRDGKSNLLMGFPLNTPQSEIITKIHATKTSDIMTEVKLKAYALYHKYIAEQSEWEINLNYTQKRVMSTAFGQLDNLTCSDMNMNDTYELFEDVTKEMKRLLAFSLTRFKVAPDFSQVMEIFKDDEALPETLVNLDNQISHIEDMLTFA
eukprot:84432_1